MTYETTAFINCPFDKNYQKLLKTLIFILMFYEFDVLISVNRNSAKDRLDEIIKHIKKSKYTFHDLSRHKSKKAQEYSRFNMPFELGIDFGCYNYLPSKKDKVIAILDKDAHAYDVHLSDLSGRDIIHHNNSVDQLLIQIPKWLENSTSEIYDSHKKLKGYYGALDADLKKYLRKHKFKVSEFTIHQYIKFLKVWIPKWKDDNNYENPQLI